MVLAPTEAVCCHSTDTSTKTDATKISASATCDTGREGKGLTSWAEPSSSVSSCQPGKVARRMKQMKARMMATILGGVSGVDSRRRESGGWDRIGNGKKEKEGKRT